MADPNGQRLLYLEDGERLVLAKPGVELSDGYVVKSIDKQTLTLQHSRLQAMATIELPPDEGPPDH